MRPTEMAIPGADPHAAKAVVSSAAAPKPDLDALMKQFRAVAGSSSHVSQNEQRLHLEVRQARHAQMRAETQLADHKTQSEAELARLQEEVVFLRGIVRDAGHLSGAVAARYAPVTQLRR